MGIKGIYRELGPGKRVALAKLAADSFEDSDRPFRIAIDIAIWQFQSQAARGGTNPAIRTLFYRLVRLLGTPVQPIFVFDGPHKPTFKRNKRSGRGDGVATALAKRVIGLFGFAVHDAPGEAEAECALLQKHGIVDAVLSEDVDTIMFGCTKTLRNWSAEGKSSKTPTHVSMYDVHDPSLAKLGLDREGMVLVALMSGGDYMPDGIPGCGVKVACEAAKAGFGKSICRLKASDKEGVRAWRESLVQELQTNENQTFRTKHKALAIPDDFPNLEVLRYYTHPVVSQPANLDAIRQNLGRHRDMHLDGLREFTRETFDWDFRIGAIKFIRVLGQALLVQKIRQGEAGSAGHIQRISGRRQHFSTDAVPELRLAYIPQDVVPIDLSKETDEDISYGRDGLALNSDDEFEAPADAAESLEDPKQRTSKIFDVTKPDLAWVLEGVVRKSVPELVRKWEEAEQIKAIRKSPTKKKKTVGTRGKKTASMPRGALDGYVQLTKSTTAREDRAKRTPEPSQPQDASPPRPRAARLIRPPPPLEPSKQSTPTAPRILAKPSTPWTIPSSPMTPRPERPAGPPETIVISSSPPAAASSPPPSPSPRPRVPAAGRQEMPGSIRAILSAGDVPDHVRSQGRRGVNVTAKTQSPAKATGFKQTSMDMFTQKSSQSTAPPAATIESRDFSLSSSHEDEQPQPATQNSDLDLEPLSLLLSEPPPSPSKRRAKPIISAERCPSTGPSRKKKLLVPSASADGFFTEVEMDAEERDAVIARHTKLLGGRGGRTGVVRWSDVSLIDLTEAE